MSLFGKFKKEEESVFSKQYQSTLGDLIENKNDLFDDIYAGHNIDYGKQVYDELYEKVKEKGILKIISDYSIGIDWEREIFRGRPDTQEVWDDISRFEMLSERFLNRYEKEVNWKILSGNNFFNRKSLLIFYEKEGLDWEILTKKFIFDIKELDLYKDKIRWEMLTFDVSKKKHMEMIRKFSEYVNWSKVIVSSLTIYDNYDFIEQFKDKLDWSKIDYGSLVPIFIDNSKFFDTYINYIDWDKCCPTYDFTLEELKKYKHKINAVLYLDLNKGRYNLRRYLGKNYDKYVESAWKIFRE